MNEQVSEIQNIKFANILLQKALELDIMHTKVRQYVINQFEALKFSLSPSKLLSHIYIKTREITLLENISQLKRTRIGKCGRAGE